MYRHRLWEILGASGIVNIGFCILALIPGETSSLIIAITYLISYLLLSFNFVAFIFCFLDEKGNFVLNTLHDLRMIRGRDSDLALHFVINNFSLAGMPPFIGFISKALVCFHLFGNAHPFVAVSALYFASFSIFFYLSLISHAYFYPRTQRANYLPVSLTARRAVRLSTTANVIFILTLPYTMVLLHQFFFL